MSQQSMNEFLLSLASKAPVPGGGGASALGGAIGAALASMVANLTIGKKKYAAVEPEVTAILEKAISLQEKMELLIQEDARVFEPLSKAYGLPKDTPEQLAYRETVMEKASLEATLVPLKIMEEAVRVLSLHQELAEKGSRLAVSDVGVGVQFCRAALLGGVMNVYINTKGMKDRETAQKLDRQAEGLVKEGTDLADEIYAQVLSAIR